MALHVAKHAYAPAEPDELALRAGEPVLVLETDDAFGDGWWRGRTKDGRTGLFPSTFVAPAPTPDPETARAFGLPPPAAGGAKAQLAPPHAPFAHPSPPVSLPPSPGPGSDYGDAPEDGEADQPQTAPQPAKQNPTPSPTPVAERAADVQLAGAPLITGDAPVTVKPAKDADPPAPAPVKQPSSPQPAQHSKPAAQEPATQPAADASKPRPASKPRAVAPGVAALASRFAQPPAPSRPSNPTNPSSSVSRLRALYGDSAPASRPAPQARQPKPAEVPPHRPRHGDEAFGKHPAEWTPEEVATWLRASRLPDVADAFLARGVAGPELLSANLSALRAEYGVENLGSRMGAMHAVMALRERAARMPRSEGKTVPAGKEQVAEEVVREEEAPISDAKAAPPEPAVAPEQAPEPEPEPEQEVAPEPTAPPELELSIGPEFAFVMQAAEAQPVLDHAPAPQEQPPKIEPAPTPAPAPAPAPAPTQAKPAPAPPALAVHRLPAASIPAAAQPPPKSHPVLRSLSTAQPRPPQPRPVRSLSIAPVRSMDLEPPKELDELSAIGYYASSLADHPSFSSDTLYVPSDAGASKAELPDAGSAGTDTLMSEVLAAIESLGTGWLTPDLLDIDGIGKGLELDVGPAPVQLPAQLPVPVQGAVPVRRDSETRAGGLVGAPPREGSRASVASVNGSIASGYGYEAPPKDTREWKSRSLAGLIGLPAAPKITPPEVRIDFSGGPPDREGWLYVRGPQDSGWRKRWCVLMGSTMHMTGGPGDTRVQATIPLHQRYAIEPDAPTGLLDRGRTPHRFRAHNPAARTYAFCAETQVAMVQWVDSLVRATKAGRKPAVPLVPIEHGEIGEDVIRSAVHFDNRLILPMASSEAAEM